MDPDEILRKNFLNIAESEMAGELLFKLNDAKKVLKEIEKMNFIILGLDFWKYKENRINDYVSKYVEVNSTAWDDINSGDNASKPTINAAKALFNTGLPDNAKFVSFVLENNIVEENSYRELTEEEKNIIEKMLSKEFRGRNELLLQFKTAKVRVTSIKRRRKNYNLLQFKITSKEKSSAWLRDPVRATAFDEDGDKVTFNLLVKDGFLDGLFFSSWNHKLRNSVPKLHNIEVNIHFDERNYYCLCCGYKTLYQKPSGTFEICHVCGWEDDFADGGANHVTLKQAKENFKKYGLSDKRENAYGINLYISKPPEDLERHPNWEKLYYPNEE